MVHVPQAQKPSDQVSRREVTRRTAHVRDVGNTVSGGHIDTHAVHHLQQKPYKERATILQEAMGKELVLEILEGEAVVMKGDTGMSWYALDKLRCVFYSKG